MTAAQLNIEFVANRLGNQTLVYSSYTFKVKTEQNDIVFWICTTRNCSAAITSLNNLLTKL